MSNSIPGWKKAKRESPFRSAVAITGTLLSVLIANLITELFKSEKQELQVLCCAFLLLQNEFDIQNEFGLNEKGGFHMFRKGTYTLNPDPNFNFQLNRVVMWGNGDPDEIRKVSQGITDSVGWVKALTGLAEAAEKNGNTERQIGYLHVRVFYV